MKMAVCSFLIERQNGKGMKQLKIDEIQSNLLMCHLY